MLKTIGAHGSWCSVQVVLTLSFGVNWWLGNFCVTGVYQAAARRGAAALGGPSAAAAPGAGRVTGNAPYLSRSVAVGLLSLSLPSALGRSVVLTRPFWLALWAYRLKRRCPPWSCCFGHILRWLLFTDVFPVKELTVLFGRQHGFEQNLAFGEQTSVPRADSSKHMP